MAYHCFYNSYLLPVFLTKIRFVGLDDIEQATNHLTNTIEVTRTVGTLHHC